MESKPKDIKRWKKTSIYQFEQYEFVLIVKSSGQRINGITSPEVVSYTQVLPIPIHKKLNDDLQYGRLINVLGSVGVLCLLESNIALEMKYDDNILWIAGSEETRSLCSGLFRDFTINGKQVGVATTNFRELMSSSTRPEEIRALFGGIGITDVQTFQRNKDPRTKVKPNKDDDMKQVTPKNLKVSKKTLRQDIMMNKDLDNEEGAIASPISELEINNDPDQFNSVLDSNEVRSQIDENSTILKELRVILSKMIGPSAIHRSEVKNMAPYEID